MDKQEKILLNAPHIVPYPKANVPRHLCHLCWQALLDEVK